MSTDAPGGSADRERRPSTSAFRILRRSIARVAADPALALPFAAAGLVLSAVDWLRVRDPVPTTTPDRVGDVTVSVAYQIYPAGFRATGTRLAALVDLRPQYLAWAVGAELVALLAVGAAGWLTLARAGRVELSGERLVAYLGLVVAVRLVLRFFALFDGLAWVTLAALVLLAVVYVRWFAAPALVVAGDGPRRAVRRSGRISKGEGVTAFGLVLAVGLSTWLLGSVPLVGAFLSSAVVAPVHAVAVVVFAESAGRAAS